MIHNPHLSVRRKYGLLGPGHLRLHDGVYLGNECRVETEEGSQEPPSLRALQVYRGYERPVVIIVIVMIIVVGGSI